MLRKLGIKNVTSLEVLYSFLFKGIKVVIEMVQKLAIAYKISKNMQKVMKLFFADNVLEVF